jgi:hypothetical protein
MSVERGFARLTAVVSATILLVGLTLAFYTWNEERREWVDAIAPPKGDVVVYLAGLGIRAGFPSNTSKTELLKSLAGLEEEGFEDLGKKVKEKYSEYNDLTDLELGKTVADQRPEVVKELRPMKGKPGGDEGDDPVTYVYHSVARVEGRV